MLPFNRILFAVCLMAGAVMVRGNDTKLAPVSFDVVQVPEKALIFPVEAGDLQPDISRFSVTYRAFLSDANGGRYALVTLAKETTNSFSVDPKDFVGTLANGKRIYPLSVEGENRIEEMGTVLLDFGAQRFPLVKVETRN